MSIGLHFFYFNVLDYVTTVTPPRCIHGAGAGVNAALVMLQVKYC